MPDTSPAISAPGPAAGVSRAELVAALDACLHPSAFSDYGPNGLQVQGRPRVTHLVTGVTSSLALIEAAVAAGADALLVHHGLFWRGFDGCLTGWMHTRVKTLLVHDVNLLAYHLPLDAHPALGNNAQLARVLGFTPLPTDARPTPPAGDKAAALGSWPHRFGDQRLGFLGATPCGTLAELVRHAERQLGRTPVWVGDPNRPVRTVAWCTGGAQSYFEDAIAAGADAFITGEISEAQAHYARETGVGFLSCGHHATERYGVQALGDHLATTLGLRHTFIDIDNPA